MQDEKLTVYAKDPAQGDLSVNACLSPTIVMADDGVDGCNCERAPRHEFTQRQCEPERVEEIEIRHKHQLETKQQCDGKVKIVDTRVTEVDAPRETKSGCNHKAHCGKEPPCIRDAPKCKK